MKTLACDYVLGTEPSDRQARALYEYAASDPLQSTDASGLACCCKSIYVFDVGGGLRKVQNLGPIANAEHVAYGFIVEVTAAISEGHNIRDCKVEQRIFMLLKGVRADGSRWYNLTDSGHRLADVDPHTAALAETRWWLHRPTWHLDIPSERLLTNLDLGHPRSAMWQNPWVRWEDAPGTKAHGLAKAYREIELLLIVLVSCVGTDGAKLGGSFKVAHRATSDGRAFASKQPLVWPRLPRTWKRSAAPQPSESNQGA
jgi:hypothetical protein